MARNEHKFIYLYKKVRAGFEAIWQHKFFELPLKLKISLKYFCLVMEIEENGLQHIWNIIIIRLHIFFYLLFKNQTI